MSALIKSKWFYGWTIVAIVFFMSFLVSGARISFGVFFKPILTDFGWDRAALSSVVSVNMLVYGISSPLIGRLADRYGPKIVISISLLVFAIGMIAMNWTFSLWYMYIVYGIIVALGFSGASSVSVATLVRRWFNRKSGMAMGIAMAGIPTGQLLVIPLAAYLIILYGWRTTNVILGILILLMVFPLIMVLVKSNPSEKGCLTDGDAIGGETANPIGSMNGMVAVNGRMDISLKGAIGTAPFWLLASGWFTCGFTGFLVMTHLVPFATDIGLSPLAAANALAILGGMSVVGTAGIGVFSDRLGRKNPLALVYFLRVIALPFLMSVTAASGPAPLYVFAVIYGLTNLATLPLTSSMVADLYGPKYMGIIVGTISVIHQIGAALGIYLGGAIFDLTGSYYWAFFMGIILAFIASISSFMIKEREYQIPVPITVE